MNDNRWRLAAIQMVSGPDLDANLRDAGALIAQAADGGARFVVLPETFACFDSARALEIGRAERAADGPVRGWMAEQARRHGIWLVGGSLPVCDDDDPRPRAASFLYDDTGREMARYDKLHLFDVDLPDGQQAYRESDTYAPGRHVCALPAGPAQLGMTICYDLRFPELYRLLFQRGVDLVTVPSAFTRVTGAAHWHTLLRARAIENQCFIVAPDQGGVHTARRETWGGSVIIDPWGRVLACAATGPGVITAEWDAGVLAEVRGRIPVRRHQRLRLAEGALVEES